jgi:chemotaxis protein histidine kinase CheA
MTGSGDRKTPRRPRLDSAAMRPAPRSVRVVLACVAVAASAMLVLTGCGGGDETITPEEAAEVNSALEQVRDTYNNDNCEGNQEALTVAKEELDALDLGGDAAETADALFARVEELSADCVPVATTAPEEPVPTETFEEPTTSSTTEETTTDTTTTTETEPSVEEEEPPAPQGPPDVPPGQDDDGDDDEGGTGGAVPPGQADKRSKPEKPGKDAKKPKHGKGKEEGKK